MPLYKTQTTPSYTNPLASGFRKSEITVATTGGQITGTPADGLWGYLTNSWFWATSAAARTITWTFPVPVRMTAISFFQDNTASQGNWQMAGSNDGAAWTDLGSPFAWGGAGLSEGTFINVNFYTQYRLTLSSGSTSSSPFQQQQIFKLVPQW